MPIALENGFHVSHDSGLGTRLGIESSRLEDCIKQIKKQKIPGVFGAPCFGFSGSEVDFLTEVPWIEDIWFWDVDLKNVDGLYALENLRHFGVHPKRPPIDFSRFTKLEQVVIEPKARDCGLGKLQGLRLLHIWHFRPKDGSFRPLDLPQSIIELQINWANVESLASLPCLPNLKRLEMHRCRNLSILGNLGEKFPNLEYLVVDACGRVTQDEGKKAVADLPNLNHACVQRSILV